ncbi:hypothetical protein LEP1GSC158_0273 [Leptospira interrogans serovar Zanoni str. LT2156]|nr:hypothetical protein LEP1GSC158_0273 [Leptospira interrogans serovar Zanoni str. LT2156]
MISKIREWKIFYPGLERSSSFPDVRWVLVRILLIFAVLVCVFLQV